MKKKGRLIYKAESYIFSRGKWSLLLQSLFACLLAISIVISLYAVIVGRASVIKKTFIIFVDIFLIFIITTLPFTRDAVYENGITLNKYGRQYYRKNFWPFRGIKEIRTGTFEINKHPVLVVVIYDDIHDQPIFIADVFYTNDFLKVVIEECKKRCRNVVWGKISEEMLNEIKKEIINEIKEHLKYMKMLKGKKVRSPIIHYEG